MTLKSQAAKEKMAKLVFMKIRNLYIKRHYQQSRKATNRMGENIQNHV